MTIREALIAVLVVVTGALPIYLMVRRRRREQAELSNARPRRYCWACRHFRADTSLTLESEGLPRGYCMSAGTREDPVAGPVPLRVNAAKKNHHFDCRDYDPIGLTTVYNEVAHRCRCHGPG